MGTFVMRKPPSELLNASFCNLIQASSCFLNQLKQAANEALAQDSSLRGLRRHKQDPFMHYYSFEEMLLYVQKLYQLDIVGAMEMTRSMWKHACANQFDDENWNWIDHEATDDEGFDQGT